MLGSPGGARGEEPACQCRRPKRGVWSLGREDPQKETATHSSILAWKSPWTEKPGGLQFMGLQRIGHDWARTWAHINTHQELFFPFYRWRNWGSSARQSDLLEETQQKNQNKALTKQVTGSQLFQHYAHTHTHTHTHTHKSEVSVAVVQSLSHIQLFKTLWTAACQASLSFTISQSLLRFMSTELVILTNHLLLCHHLILLLLIFHSIRVFSNESALRIRWPKFGASASVFPMNIQGWFPLGLTGLISLLFQSLLRWRIKNLKVT